MRQILVAILAFVGAYYAVHMATRREFPTPRAGDAILVTGASSGIGQHAAAELASQGYVVFAGVRKEKDAEAARQLGLVPVTLEVTDDASIATAKAVVEQELAKRGSRLVGLVNNAGVSGGAPLEMADEEQARFLMEVNVWGVFKVTKAFGPLLRASGGRLINISSLMGLMTLPTRGWYAASKHALEAMSDAYRQELAPHGVSVSVVEPGYVRTSIGEKGQQREVPAAYDAVYGDIMRATIAKREKSFEMAVSPDDTTAAIVHALTDPFPNTRYPTAAALGAPAWLVVRLAQWVPDRVFDLAVAR